MCAFDDPPSLVLRHHKSLYIFPLITWTSLESISLVYHAWGWVMTIFHSGEKYSRSWKIRWEVRDDEEVEEAKICAKGRKNLIKIFLRIVNKIVTRRHAMMTRWNKENDNKALFTLERCPLSTAGSFFTRLGCEWLSKTFQTCWINP